MGDNYCPTTDSIMSYYAAIAELRKRYLEGKIVTDNKWKCFRCTQTFHKEPPKQGMPQHPCLCSEDGCDVRFGHAVSKNGGPVKMWLIDSTKQKVEGMNQGAGNAAFRLEAGWTTERRIDFVRDWFDLDCDLGFLEREYDIPRRKCQDVALRLGAPKRQVIRGHKGRTL